MSPIADLTRCTCMLGKELGTELDPATQHLSKPNWVLSGF